MRTIWELKGLAPEPIVFENVVMALGGGFVCSCLLFFRIRLLLQFRAAILNANHSKFLMDSLKKHKHLFPNKVQL